AVARGSEITEVALQWQCTGTGLVPAGVVGNLHVGDASRVVGNDPVDVVAVHSEVIQVGKQPDAVGTVLRADPIDHGECVGRGAQRVLRGAADRLQQYRATHAGRSLRCQCEVLCGEFILAAV